MILYFDTYITNTPFHAGFQALREYEAKLYSAGCNYKKESKINIVKYVLASYGHVPWSNVLIRYELEQEDQKESFDQYIREVFPNAVILHTRSDSQEEYRKSMKILDAFEDDWIFYSPNNDHPIVASNIDCLMHLCKKAEKMCSLFGTNVSIPYSHFTESVNSCREGNPFHTWYSEDSSVVEEDAQCVCVLRPHGDLTAAQILHKDLFRYWFFSRDMRGARIVRSEDALPFLGVPAKQIQVVSKQEICRHFEGYSHLLFIKGNGIAKIYPDEVPPLFIPPGFFDGNIKIACGYDEYRHNWVNINPLRTLYSFQDPIRGTDLKLLPEDMPLFWKDRISEIDINPKADMNLMKMNRDRAISIVANPFFERSPSVVKFGNWLLKIRKKYLSARGKAAFFYRKYLDIFPKK